VKRLLFLLILIFLASVSALSQTVTDCPHPDGCVVISRSAAIKSLETDDEVKTLREENKVLKQAVASHKDIETTLKIELGKTVGELTGTQKTVIQLTGWLDIAMKNSRKKCMPLSVCF